MHVHTRTPMSNPARAPTELTLAQTVLNAVPQAYFDPTGTDFARESAQTKVLEWQQRQLDGLDMEIHRAFYLPPALCVDPRVSAATSAKLALAKTGKLHFRLRTKEAGEVCRLVYLALPVLPISLPGGKTMAGMREELLYQQFGRTSSGVYDIREANGLEYPPPSWILREGSDPGLSEVMFVDGGTEYTVGRLRAAYPKVGAKVSKRITEAEAARAVVACGLPTATTSKPLPLVSLHGEDAVRGNPKADNGFPVLGTWGDPEAQRRVLGLAMTLQAELEAAYRQGGRHGVWLWLRGKEATHPELVALRGKAKADYYKNSKLTGLGLRFYNALPRQLLLVMQRATQVVEGESRSILDDDTLHTTIGASLTHLGAHRLVAALGAQLDRQGYAFAHCGDDSWVVVRMGSRLVMFALDCSNFDLTQHSALTENAHEAIHSVVARVEPVAAALWFAYARERLVVTIGSLVRRFYHGGVSGMPLQSKVNDVIMHVALERIVQQLQGATTGDLKGLVTATIEGVAKGMGLVVKTEQFYCGLWREGFPGVFSIYDLLTRSPFQFLGYYFVVHRLPHERTLYEGAEVLPCADIPRTMRQLRYPSFGWKEDRSEGKKLLGLLELMRMGSIYLNLGVPPPCFLGAFTVWKKKILGQINALMNTASVDVDHPALVWAVSDNPFGTVTAPSLRGLRDALLRQEDLWRKPKELLPPLAEGGEPPLGSVESQLARFSWADEPENPALVKPIPVPPKPEPTHKASRANDGRPPPTAVWGPDKPPRADGAGPSNGKKSRKSRFEREVHFEQFGESSSGSWGDFEREYETDTSW